MTDGWTLEEYLYRTTILQNINMAAGTLWGQEVWWQRRKETEKVDKVLLLFGGNKIYIFEYIFENTHLNIILKYKIKKLWEMNKNIVNRM